MDDKCDNYKPDVLMPGDFNEDITAYVLEGCPYSQRAASLLSNLSTDKGGKYIQKIIYIVDNYNKNCLSKEGTLTALKKLGKVKNKKTFKHKNTRKGNKTFFSKDTKDKIMAHRTFPLVFTKKFNSKGEVKGNEMLLLDSTDFSLYINDKLNG